MKERFEAAEKVILNAATVQDALEWADLKLGQECNPIPSSKQQKYDRLFEGEVMEDALKLALQCKFIDRKTGEPTQEGKLLLTTGDQAISIQDDSGSTKWQSSYSEHYLDKKGNVIMKNDEPVTNTYEGNNLMGQELEKIRAKIAELPQPEPSASTDSEYQNLPSSEEMLAAARAEQTEEAPTPTSHYQSLPIVDEEIKRRHEAGKRAAEQAAMLHNPVDTTTRRKTNAIAEMMSPVMPVHERIDPTTGRLKDLSNLNYSRYLHDGQLTPLEEGKQIATSYTDKEVVEFSREQETPATRELGNYHPAPIRLTFHGEELTFQNAEAAFQAAKVMHMFGDDPKAAEVIGRLKNARIGDETIEIMNEFNAKLDADETRSRLWGTISQQVMYQILMAKFTQNPDLREKLLSTGDKPLIANTSGIAAQASWGVNTSGANAGTGKNQLGRLLEVLRDSLRQ